MREEHRTDRRSYAGRRGDASSLLTGVSLGERPEQDCAIIEIMAAPHELDPEKGAERLNCHVRNRRAMMQMLLGLVANQIPVSRLRGAPRPAMADELRRPRNSIAIFLCGDVMLGRGIDQVLPHPSASQLHEPYVSSALDYVRLAENAHGLIPKPVGFDYVWGAALEEWQRIAPDLRFINLETTITRSDSYEPKGINYRMSPENAGCLLAAEIDGCSLANNHILDWGEAGLIETLQVLQRHGITAIGAGRNLTEAGAPVIRDIPDKGRVIIFSYATTTSGTPMTWAAMQNRAGVNFLPTLSDAAVDQIARQVRAVRRTRDIVVASIHWGPNWGYAIPDEHRRFAHALIDRAGISVLHGHSSHHPIAIERYRNRLILYGCGDFINDYEGIAGYEEFRGDLSLMYFVSLEATTGDLISLEMAPLQIRRFRLNRAAREDAAWLHRRLDRECRSLGGRIILRPGNQLVLSWPG
jgi:poly-gamma-glutamate capsule biosynthesis protein CapA/YwtB (metallophosphatase superfamily)